MDFSSLMSDTSIFFAIFLVAALAGMVSERSGVFNIAIEGYMIIGALVYSICGKYMSGWSNYTQILSMIITVAFCGLLSVLQSLASIKLKADQIISGTAMNMLTQGFGLFFVTSGLFGTGTSINSGYKTIRFFGNGTFTLYLLIAVLIAIGIGIYFTFTKVGKWHIAAGENPNALDAVGLSVIKFRWGASTASGGLAGLAGCFYIVYLNNNFTGTTGGLGFLALAIMIVGQWRTSYITVAAFGFALFFSLGTRLPYSNIKWFSTNQYIINALPFVLSLGVMIGTSKFVKIPKADGIPFDKSKR